MKIPVLLATLLCLEPGPSSATMTFSPHLNERREFDSPFINERREFDGPFLNERREFDSSHRMRINNGPVVSPYYDVRHDSNPVDIYPQRTPDVDSSDRNDLLDTGEPIQLELPDDLDIENMQVGERERDAINNVRSMEDFLKLFNLPPPEEEEEDDTNGIFARIGKDVAVNAVKSPCEPKNQTVVLTLPKDPNFTFFPTCVHLMRCGGCCKGASTSCQAIKRSPVTLKILKIEKGNFISKPTTRNASGRHENRGTRPRAAARPSPSNAPTRSTRDTKTTLTDVHQYNDVACKCLCITKAEDCDPKTHSYSADECACRCKNKEAKVECQKKVDTHYWDDASCNCYCNKNNMQTCSSWQKFDHTDCTCIRTSESFMSGRSSAASQDPPYGGYYGDHHASGPIHFE